MWPAIIVGGISAAASLAGASQASSQARKDRKSQEASMAAQLAFEREKYDDWQQVFGSVSSTLGDFYGSLDADTLTSLGLEENREAFSMEQEQLQRKFAQQGIDTPAQQMLAQDASIQLAEREASIRYNAPLQLADAKNDFVASGRGATNPNSSGVSNAMAQRSDAYGASAARNSNAAATGYAAAGRAIDGSVSAYMAEQERNRNEL